MPFTGARHHAPLDSPWSDELVQLVLVRPRLLAAAAQRVSAADFSDEELGHTYAALLQQRDALARGINPLTVLSDEENITELTRLALSSPPLRAEEDERRLERIVERFERQRLERRLYSVDAEMNRLLTAGKSVPEPCAKNTMPSRPRCAEQLPTREREETSASAQTAHSGEGNARTVAENGQPAAPAVPREIAVKALIERGKKRGSLTYEEIAAISAAYDEDDPEKGNELVEEIMGQGIEITEMPDRSRSKKTSRRTRRRLRKISTSVPPASPSTTRCGCISRRSAACRSSAWRKNRISPKTIERAEEELERAQSQGRASKRKGSSTPAMSRSAI